MTDEKNMDEPLSYEELIIKGLQDVKEGIDTLPGLIKADIIPAIKVALVTEKGKEVEKAPPTIDACMEKVRQGKDLDEECKKVLAEARKGIDFALKDNNNEKKYPEPEEKKQEKEKVKEKEKEENKEDKEKKVEEEKKQKAKEKEEEEQEKKQERKYPYPYPEKKQKQKYPSPYPEKKEGQKYPYPYPQKKQERKYPYPYPEKKAAEQKEVEEALKGITAKTPWSEVHAIARKFRK